AYRFEPADVAVSVLELPHRNAEQIPGYGLTRFLMLGVNPVDYVLATDSELARSQVDIVLVILFKFVQRIVCIEVFVVRIRASRSGNHIVACDRRIVFQSVDVLVPYKYRCFRLIEVRSKEILEIVRGGVELDSFAGFRSESGNDIHEAFKLGGFLVVGDTIKTDILIRPCLRGIVECISEILLRRYITPLSFQCARRKIAVSR